MDTVQKEEVSESVQTREMRAAGSGRLWDPGESASESKWRQSLKWKGLQRDSPSAWSMCPSPLQRAAHSPGNQPVPV